MSDKEDEVLADDQDVCKEAEDDGSWEDCSSGVDSLGESSDEELDGEAEKPKKKERVYLMTEQIA